MKAPLFIAASHQIIRTKYVSRKYPAIITKNINTEGYAIFLINLYYVFNETVFVDPEHP